MIPKEVQDKINDMAKAKFKVTEKVSYGGGVQDNSKAVSKRRQWYKDGLADGYSLRDNEDRWIAVDMPKDGTAIIRWHKIWKCPIAVTYRKPGTSKYCWMEKTLGREWPEEAFIPDLWQPLPASPSIKLK